MKSQGRAVFILLVAALAIYGLWAFVYTPAQQESQGKRAAMLKESSEKRKQKLDAEIAKGPKITAHKTAYGEVLHIKLPTKGSENSSRVNWVDCIVWRDTDLSRVSMSCPAEADLKDVDLSDMAYGEAPSVAPSRQR